MTEVIKTFCSRLCGGTCGILVHVEGGKIIRVEGDPALRMNPDLDPRVVIVAHGWWFPERDSSDLYGWQEANLNLLTASSPPHDPAMGTANLRGLICKVYKAYPEPAKGRHQI